MTLTNCQQIILHCIFIAPEDKTAFKRYRDSERIKNNPEVRTRVNKNSQKWREANPEKHRQNVRRQRENPAVIERERQYRIDNRPSERVRERERYASIRRKINLLKLERPCYDCGGMFPPYMTDWDHLPQYEKKFLLGHDLKSFCLEAIVEEINKCQLVCANCHRARTEARKKDKVS